MFKMLFNSIKNMNWFFLILIRDPISFAYVSMCVCVCVIYFIFFLEASQTCVFYYHALENVVVCSFLSLSFGA